MSKKKYYNLGNMMVAKKDNPEDPTRYYIKLEQSKNKKTGESVGEQIFPIRLANGVVLNDGDIVSMYPKKPKLDKLVEENKISQDTADKIASFVKFELVAVKQETEKENKDFGPEPTFNDKEDIPF